MLKTLKAMWSNTVARKWLLGRRIILSFPESSDASVLVMELPDAKTLSFGLKEVEKDNRHYTALVLIADGGAAQELAVFEAKKDAERALGSVRRELTRPWRKVVKWLLIGVLFMMFLDAVTTPPGARGRSARGPVSQPSSQLANPVNNEQLRALRESLEAAGAGGPGASSEPDAAAALRLLKGDGASKK